MIDGFALVLGLVGGGLVVGLWARRVGRRRDELRALSLEAHRQTLEVGSARARADLLKVEAREKAIAEELAVARRTAASARVELEALRAAFEEADHGRDIAAHRIENARMELASSRARISELEHQLETLVAREPVAAGSWAGSGLGAGEAVETAPLPVPVQNQDAVELSRIEAELDAVRQERDRLARALTEERRRGEAALSQLADRVAEQERQLGAAINASREAGAERDLARARVDGLAVRLGDLESALRAERVAHQEELASLAAQRGALLAQVERLEPLRRQVADREELIRSLARERDDATAALLRIEREAVAQGEELAALRHQREELAGASNSHHTRVVELEARLAVMARERDQADVEQKRLTARIESLRAEIRERDVRFRALLDDRRSFVEASRAQEAKMREDLVRARLSGPSVNGRPPAAEREDLKRIYGIGPAIERLLSARGITTYRQLAELTESDLDEISRSIGGYRGRIARDHWAEQARREHERTHGERLD
ncbi:MAG: hypothetical protein KF785_01705 [Gemmatimonadales bacterium]|nr:hypothetical protein [Gemmatimonadales bacterium]